MSQVYQRAITVNGPVDRIFDELPLVLQTKGFTINNVAKPYALTAERGMSVITMKVQKHPHTLVISMHPNGNGMALSFMYILNNFWNFTPGDKVFFDEEIKSIATSVSTAASLNLT
jgi:hypothetical protein